MRPLRPFAYALGWLVLFEALLRLCWPPDPRTVRDPEHPYGCFADEALAQLLAARGRPAAAASSSAESAAPLDVVLVGDSVMASVENAAGERLADALAPALQKARRAAGQGERPLRVWTIAAGGARASDVYALLRRLDQELRRGPRGTRDVLVVVSSNPIFFSRRHQVPPMAYPCLASALPTPAELTDGDERAARQALPAAAATPLKRLEQRLLGFATEHIYLLQQRRRLAEALFGGPPRLALREHLQLLHAHRRHGRRAQAASPADAAAERNRPWSQRGLTAAQFAQSYDFVPLQSPAAYNRLWTRALARWLGARRDLQALAVLVPQNHAMLGGLAQGPAYAAVTTEVAAAFASAEVPFVSFDGDPAIRSEHFLDLDHLTAEGNRALAGRLATALTQRLAAVPSGAE
jgi:hypothetical protein